MGAKRALIVDDSKSARMFLSRILEKYDIDVDDAESAEQAIEYLGSNRPDVIFMDHMMPGMDGFQAVQVIKNNPRTAMIPILMYTSQQGELYLGQARALGAVGVLPKQIKPTDVSKVLYQLHLVPDRRTAEQSTFQSVSSPGADAHGEMAPAPRGLTDVTLREHLAELRRVLVANLDSQAERIGADLRTILQDAPPHLPTASTRRSVRAAYAPWVLSAAALALAAALGLGWRQEVARSQALVAEFGQLRASLAARAAAPAPAATPTPAADAREATSVAPPRFAAGPVSSAVAPRTAGFDESKPLVASVPYGSEPLSGPRLELLRQLFEQLSTENYRGTVEIRTFAGRFCLIGNSVDGYSLAPDETPFAKCDALASSSDEAPAQPQRVPLAFANLLGVFRNRTHGAVDVQVVPGDTAVQAVAYPTVSEALTAGEWNRAGNANNRIEIRVR
jgi:CheY-like chemotaxis protein